MPLAGLTWWFPLKIGKSRVTQAWIDKQRLPYHGILMTHVAAAGGIMLDLGANIGRMSISRAVLGEVTAAYCAEPDPLSYACLASNVIDNGLHGVVLPDQTAIGDRDGVVRLLALPHVRTVPRRVRDSESGVETTGVLHTLDNWVRGLTSTSTPSPLSRSTSQASSAAGRGRQPRHRVSPHLLADGDLSRLLAQGLRRPRRALRGAQALLYPLHPPESSSHWARRPKHR